ncbi:MAG: hypothetical protein GWN56_14615, partial [Nitrosopumilaceae archaeon]|nr:hypothetical protein [Nitrosopumilaceae archaeon]
MVDYQEEIEKISSALPLQYSASSLFSFIQKTASENGLIINTAGLSTKPSRRSQAASEV